MPRARDNHLQQAMQQLMLRSQLITLCTAHVLLQAATSDNRTSPLNIKAMRQAIAAGFAATDAQVLAQAEQHHWVDGAVCVAVWVIQETVFVANVGLKKQLSHIQTQLPNNNIIIITCSSIYC